jgi:arsenate reductase
VTIATEVPADLIHRFAGVFDATTIEHEVRRAARLFGSDDVLGYVTDRLRAIAAGRDLRGLAEPTVLFVCVHNAGRSQMAASLLRRKAPRVTVLSAGSQPAAAVSPAVFEVMAELGIDLRSARPAKLEVETVKRADLAVTMGCGDACPVLPGTAYLDWALPDPAGQPVEVVRGIRDEIASRVDDLVDGLS